jgi:PAS domain S-box-containing protein
MDARAKTALRLVLLIAAYMAAAKLGMGLDAVAGFATLVWAPTGIALAALLRFGVRFWPGVFVAAFAVNAWTGAAFPVALGIALGNTLEAVVACHVLRRLGFQSSLDRLRDVALLVAVAFGSSLVSATIGASSLLAGGVIGTTEFASTLRAWWLGDSIGALIIAPLLLTWSHAYRGAGRPQRWLEALALLVVALGGGLFVFHGPVATLLGAFRQPFLLFIPAMWAAMRFGPRGATTITTVLSVLAIYGTARGWGPFVQPALHESLAHLQVFMGIAAASALTLGASIEERKHALAAQEHDHHLLRAIAEGTTDAVFVKDTEARYVLINSAGARFLGLSPEQVIHRSDHELFPAETAPELVARDRQMMSEASVRTYEETLTLADGPHVFLSTKGPYLDEKGRVIGLLGVCRDITERKIAEEGQRLLADLAPVLAQSLDHEPPFEHIATLVVERKLAERCVFELSDASSLVHAHGSEPVAARQVAFALEARGRTLGSMTLYSASELSQLKVELAQELARRVSTAIESAQLYRLACEASRARDEVLSIASHELRTPLHALVINLSHVCAMREPSNLEDTRSRIERAVRQTDRLTRLVDSLLDVSQVSAGHLHLHCEELDLTELSREVAARFADQAALTGGRIDVLASGPALGRWDRLRMEQVLTNLLSNAVKYGAGQPVVLALETSEHSVSLRVQDHGIGISEEDQGRVFERYQRAASARHFGGLGLGLFISRQIVDAHGGTLTVQSRRGEGTVFSVEVPRLSERALELLTERAVVGRLMA